MTSPPTGAPGPFVQRYREIRPRGVPALARHAALDVLGAWTRLRLALAPGPWPARVHVLNLHFVFPDEEARFRRLLTWLRDAGFRFPTYDDAVAEVRSGEIPGPAVVFTFDDGLATGLRAGEILAEHGARACYFLVTSMVGERDPARIEAFCAERIHMPPTSFLGWDDVDRLVRMGHSVGSHTHTHPVLGGLRGEPLREELGRSREILLERVGRARHFSWPYGRFHHFSPEAAGGVFQTGFESCASAERGAHAPGPPLPAEDVCLRRDHCTAGWPLGHNLWFLERGARRASAAERRWPERWRVGERTGGAAPQGPERDARAGPDGSGRNAEADPGGRNAQDAGAADGGPGRRA